MACSARTSSPLRPGTDLQAASVIEHWPALPAGAQDVGTLTASCGRFDGSTQIKRLRLSMLDCSPSFLLRVLERRAIERGASALVGLRCTELPRPVSANCVASIECHATAAKPDVSREVPDRAATIGPNPLPSADTELHSFVEIIPTVDVRPLESGELALEVPVLPLANRHWTTLRVEIEKEVSRVEALKTVRLAATRLGAKNYETPHCQRNYREGWHCVAQLSVLDSELPIPAKGE